MFAQSLTDKLIGFDKYEMISIGTMRGARKIGIPDGFVLPKILKDLLMSLAFI